MLARPGSRSLLDHRSMCRSVCRCPLRRPHAGLDAPLLLGDVAGDVCVRGVLGVQGPEGGAATRSAAWC